MGRTHGVQAEPTTFGLKLARWYAEINRDIERFKAAANRVSRILGKAKRDREAIYLDKGKPVPANLAARKIEYSKLSEKDQNSFAMMIALGSALYQVAKIEILDKKGRITKKSEKMIEEMHQLLEQV